MAKEFSRSDRVASQIQRELAALLQREAKDPRFGLVSLNAVKVTRDLSIAKIYVGSLSQEADSANQAVAALNKAASFLRRELSSRVRIRCIPELKFVYDEAVDRAQRISIILDGLVESEVESKP